MSWDEAFADRYEEWSADMTADIAFYAGLACAANGPLVELGVGNGRVAIPVAQAARRPVTGIDTSPAMLARARARAAEAGVALDLREGDMRDLALDEPAALIYCPFRALLHLPSWADRRRAFERVAASLQPGGRFAWNAFAFDHQIAARLDRRRQQEPVPHVNRYAVGDNRIDIILDTGAKSSLWWATKNEWLGLIDVAGLDLEALYGGFSREPFTDDSREYVFLARRPLSSTMPGTTRPGEQTAVSSGPARPASAGRRSQPPAMQVPGPEPPDTEATQNCRFGAGRTGSARLAAVMLLICGGRRGPGRVSRHVQETMAARGNPAASEATGPGPGHPPCARLMTCANT